MQSYISGEFEATTFEVLPSSKRSFYVHVPEGRVVLRLESHTNDLEFEVFASRIFEEIDLLTAKVALSVLPKSLISELKFHVRQHPDFELEFLLEEKRDFSISVASFFEEPFELGIEYLLRIPEYKMEMQNLSSHNEDNRELAWEYLEPGIQSNLADMWAGYVVMGIMDMHPDNWMMTLDGQVAGIDLAMRTGIFEKGMETVHWMLLMSPMGPSNFSKEHLQELLSSISPQMRQRLQALSRETILAIAAKTNFQINDVQINGMIARAKLLAGDSTLRSE